jgi:hypothetical protein
MTAICDATGNVVRDAFNTWFSSCCSSLDEVREAQRLDNALKEDDHVYHVQWWHARGSDGAGSSTS